MGPYAKTVEIDFDSLDEAGVYLLTGPTGAGKTTVLDAVSYALFNRIPKEAKGDEFVSDHRAIGVTPRVQLEASIGGERFRITRTPKHLGKKAKGTGTKSVDQSLAVEAHRNGSWGQLTGSWSEGNEVLAGKIGMNASQFSQVVMLPQGDFARFLRAGANDRKELLMRLFPGADLEWLEGWLKQRSADDREARDGKLGQIQDCFQAVKPIAETLVAEGEDALPPTDEPGPALAWITDRGKALEKRRDETAAEQEQAAAKAGRANSALEELKVKVDRIAARREAEQTRRDLDAREPWRRETAARIVAAEKANGVIGYDRSAGQLRADAAAARTRVEESSRAIAENELTAGLDRDRYEAAAQAFSAEATTIANFERSDLPERRRLSATVKELEARLESLLDEGPSSEIGKARAEAEAAVQKAAASKQELIRIRQARTDGMAAELADQLRPGEPCVVCGSTEHPSPAHGEGPQISKQDEDEAQAKADRDEATRNAAAARVAEMESEAKASQAATSSELEAARKSLAILAGKESDLAAGSATVSQRRESLEAAAELLARSINAATAAAGADEAASKAEADAARQAADSGFKSIVEAREAVLDEAALAELKTEAARHDERRALIQKQLEEQLADVNPDEEVDPGPATEAARAAASGSAQASEEAGVALDRLETFRKETGPVAGFFDQLEPLRDAARTSTALWRVAKGDNERRMNLSIFVLATRLKQVIEVANRHLQRMSDQRYELIYSGDRKGNAMAGLGIEVFDSYTSETRPTTTLSGGESFYASLALALGLAEVVQEESGGKRQETLFIDEGFGSLDPESLDKVMDVIDSLRSGGRSVGLVSHVEELKNRVTAKIVVTPGREGSTLEVLTG